MKINYSFSLTPPAPAAEELVDYPYNEFLISLPRHWKQIPTAEDSYNWQTEQEAASIIVSADFYDIPDDKAQAFAEKNLSSRLEALGHAGTGEVTTFLRTIRPHSGGTGLELSLGAVVEGEFVYVYLGYVTSRKVFNFALVSQRDRQAASDLFNSLMPHLRIKLP